MNWHSASEFLAMGGRGFFVWGAYGVSAILIGAEILLQARHRKLQLRRLHQLQQIGEG